MMDTVDYRSASAAHQMLQDQHLSPYHGHLPHQLSQQQQHQQPGGSVVAAGSRMLQSPSPVDNSYPSGAIDTSYATLQPLPSAADKFSVAAAAAAAAGSTSLLGGTAAAAAAGSGGFSGFMDEMSLSPYTAYKYDKLGAMTTDNCASMSTFAGTGSSYDMMHNGYAASHHHQSSLASLYHHHPGSAGSTGYMSPNGFQLSAHHKSLMLDTKPPPSAQMMSPGPSPGVAAYGPYSRAAAGLLSAGPPPPPSAAAAALLFPPSASSPLTAAYGGGGGGHHVFQHHHHHHHGAPVGSPATSPSSRVLHHSLPGPHRSMHELRGGPATALRGAGGTGSTATGTCHAGAGEMEEINTRDLAQKISSELKRYSIPQAVFAQRVLCRSQGTLSDLLRNPKPWSKLKSGRETFRRMWKWLQEPEYQRMSALRLAGKR